MKRILPLAAALLLLAGCGTTAQSAPTTTAAPTTTGPAPQIEVDVWAVNGCITSLEEVDDQGSWQWGNPGKDTCMNLPSHDGYSAWWTEKLPAGEQGIGLTAYGDDAGDVDCDIIVNPNKAPILGSATNTSNNVICDYGSQA